MRPVALRCLGSSPVTLCVAVLAGCSGGGGGGEPPADRLPPAVVSVDLLVTTPPLPSAVVIAFGEPLDCATANPATVLLQQAGGGAVPGTVACSGETVTLTPGVGLAYETAYTVVVTTAVRDRAGNALAAEVRWPFTTAPNPDRTAPSPLTTIPANQATLVRPGAAVTVTFDEPIDCATVTATTFEVRASGAAAPATGTLACTGATATFTPSPPLAWETGYGAVVAGVTDLAGNAMRASWEWTFTTRPALRCSAYVPSPGARQVALQTPVSALCNDMVDPASVGDSSWWVEDGAGAKVPATRAVQGNMLTLQPAALVAGTTYTVHLAGVSTSDGTTLEQALTWTFVTTPPGVGTWTAISRSGAPSPRMDHTAVWTGKEMIVWGGHDGTWVTRLSTGAAYDPATDTWRPVAGLGAPRGRVGHVAVWTGSRMIVWGGYDGAVWLDDGGLYDPDSDTWAPLALTNAPVPRSRPGGAWTGSELLIWGGYGGTDLGSYLSSGGRYVVEPPGWTAMPSGGPSARLDHGTVWTGTELIVWGGTGGGAILGDGRRFAPATSTWTAVPLAGAPAARQHHAAVWTGTEMIVWGGDDWGGDLATGGRYDPQAGTWTPTSLDGAPHPRREHEAVWTGDRMIVWGGYYGTGGIYDPVHDTWATTSVEPATPAPGAGHSAVWADGEMIVWGGYAGNGVFLDTGARYDPAGAR